MTPQEASMRWKWLMGMVDKVQDPVLKNCMIAEFRKRAINEWGFDPTDPKYELNESDIDFTPDERKFLNKIKVAQRFGAWVKDEKLERETRANMCNFIDLGGGFSDLPEELQTPYMAQLYLDCLQKNVEIIKNNFTE